MKLHIIKIVFLAFVSQYVFAASHPKLSIHSVDVGNGVILEYAEQGDKTGVPLILLHGYTDSWHSFETLMAELPTSVHVYAISQRGHGNSSRPSSGYKTTDFAGDVVAFMRKLGITKAYIGGHSMGGIIAQELVLDYPEMVKGVIIMSSDASIGKNPGMDGFLQAVKGLQDPIDPEFVKGFQQGTLTRPLTTAYFDTLVNESLKVPARVWKETLDGMMNVDFEKRLKKVSSPVLVLWGDQDMICLREDQTVFEKSIKRVSLRIYQGVGHALHWEEPARAAADIVQFIHSSK